MSIFKRTISALLVCVMLLGMVPPIAVSAEETEPAATEVSVTEAFEAAEEEETEAPSEEPEEETEAPSEEPEEETEAPSEEPEEETEAPSEEPEEETEAPCLETDPAVMTQEAEAAEAETEAIFDSTDLVKLEIRTLPDKVMYLAGETVDLTGIVLYAEDSQGLSATLGAEDVSIVSGDASTAGRHTVTVIYGNLTASFEILVHNQSQKGEVLQDSADYPESDHSYSNNIDVSYTYTCEGAEYLKLTFSDSTYVENSYDKIYLYDGGDTLLGTYTAGNLAGMTVTVTGDTVRIRLTTDGSRVYYGFSLDSIYASVDVPVHEPADEGVYTEPLCFEDGYTTHTCWICGETFIEEDTDSAAHSFTDGFCEVCGLPENQVSSGVISDTIAWAITDENVLYVSGEGEIPDNVSWSDDISAATSLIVGEGITRVGAQAFYGKSALVSVSLPDTLKSIGASAFYGCTSLTEIDLPDALESIDSNAFRNCSKLTSMYIPAGVTTISASSYSYSPFYGCSSSLVLYCAAAEKQSGWGSYWNYRGSGNALSTNYGYSREEYAYWIGLDKSAEAIVIPDGITAIPGKAFYNCTSLTSVTLPEGLASIGEYAFYGCTGLTAIALPDSLTAIHSYAFYNCGQMALEAMPASLTQIGDYAFYNCAALTDVVFPEALTSIGMYAFYGCTGLTDAAFSDGLASIGNYAFYGCSNLASVTLPESLTTLGYSVFYGCFALTELRLPGSVTTVSSSGNRGPLDGSGITKVIFGDGFTTIPAYILSSSSSSGSYASRITEVAFEAPEKITSIGNYAFYNCAVLESLTLPENITSLPSNIFNGCKCLASITLPGNLTTIESYALSGCTALTDIRIPDSVTSIGSYAFQNCTGLTAINLSNGLRTLGYSVFYGCTGLTELYLPASITTMNYSSKRGPLDGSGITKVTFADGFTSIPAYALSNYTSGTGSTYSSHIREVVFEAPEKITSIGSYAFYNCAALESFQIPENVTSIPTYAFYGCQSLTEVTWPQNLTSINNYAFQSCTSLQAAILPDTVSSIGSYSFQNCTSLEEVTIPAGASVNSYAFKDCTALTTLTIGDDAYVYDHAFNNCTALDTLALGSNVTIQKNAFYGVTLGGDCGDSMTWSLDMGTGVFTLDGSGEMADYTLEAPAPWYSLRTTITAVEFGDDVTDIGAYAFVDCNGLEAMILPNSIRTISESSFYNCENICYVEIPDGIQTIGENAFDGCEALEEVVFLGDAPVMETNCFGTSAAKVYYPETGSGFIERIFVKFIQYIWEKWDNTVPSKDVVILLDTSGSMGGKEGTLSSASTQLIKSIGGAIRKTNIAVVEYESYATTLNNFTTNTYQLVDSVSSLYASGGTNYSNALNRADSLLNGRNSDIKFVIMFSDGQPGDSSITTIYNIAAAMREKGIVIYTVGLGTNSNQRQVLINVAGSESRYFEASNIAGLIAAFQELSKNFGKSEYATVEMKINDVRYDLFNEPCYLCLASNTTISFYLTPGINDMYDNVTSIALEQGGQYVLRNDTGIFENIRPGDYFRVGEPVYMVMLDNNGNLVERRELQLYFAENYTISYVMGPDLENKVYLEDDFIPGSDIVKPSDPTRAGYEFKGWYASENCEGIEFFNELNYSNRIKLAGGLTLYAKWEEQTTDLTMSEETWTFTNSHLNFDGSCNDWEDPVNARYEMTTNDYQRLVAGLDSATKGSIDNYRDDIWGGSCFGMSTSVVLGNEGWINIYNFPENNRRFGQFGDATMTRNSPLTPENGDDTVGNIESMINFYHMRQKLPLINTILWNFTSDESANTEAIIRKMIDTDAPVALNIDLVNAGYHTVVAFDLKETADGYEFQIYDCSMSGDYSYTVQVTDTDSGYTISCDEWEEDWGYEIILGSALTSAEIRQYAILTAPNTISSMSVSASASSGVYMMTTNYGSFTISNGTSSAMISGGEKVSGDLDVNCFGMVNWAGAETEYRFDLPVLAEGETYIIGQTSTGTLKTTVYYSNSADGFFLSHSAEEAGNITVGADGSISTQYTSAVEQNLSVTHNGMTTPWYTVKVSGESAGLTLTPCGDSVAVASNEETTVNIDTKSDFNDVVLTDVPVNADAAEITESEGSCVVIQDEEIIAGEVFGYSVAFNSQMGTSVPTLTNVPYGSLITEPTDPTKTGCIFLGWFKDEECTELWDFDTDTVTQDTILYAGWSINPNYLQSVTFRIPGREDQIVYIPKGDLIPATYAPLGDDGEELVWYTNAAYTSEAWDFDNDTVTGDLVLYGETTLCVVSYVTNCGQTLEDSRLYEGMVIPEPTGLTMDGYTLCGWYTDEALTSVWDFDNDTLTESITLYAKWLPNEFDKEGSDTGICIEILNEDGYVYTGKAIKPKVVVRDDGRILKAGTDYTVSYKNNTNARAKDDTSVKASKLPQIIVQGKGNYKSTKKITKYFTIHQADMKDLQVTLPGWLAAKTGNMLQTVKATVSTGLAKVAASNYTIRYYTDGELTEAVKGITAPGRYYVTLEAKAGKNITGITDAFVIDVTSAALLVSSAKITSPKSITAAAEQPDENTAIQTLISKVILNKVTYLTDDESIEAFKALFTLTAKDSDGTEISQSDLGSILMSVGKKTVTIAAKEGNAEGFLGEKSFTVTVKGAALNKKQFQVTFDKSGETTTTKSQYSGVSQVPAVISDLELNTDYTVTYKSGKKVLTALQVKNAGSYTLVITGKGAYSGTLNYSFSITRADIAKAYKNGDLKIRHSGEAVYDPTGAKLVPSVSYMNVKGTQMAMVAGTDYTISYSGNKTLTEKAAMTLKGKGNFTGTLSKVSELTYSVVKKPISAGDITVTVTGLILKKGEITGVKYTVYHAGKKVAASQYTSELTDNDNDTMTLKIVAKEKLYTGTRSLTIRKDLIKATDTKKVKITLPKENRYYSGSAIQPKPIITDAEGKDISDCFTVTYGSNTKVGIGTVTVTGRPDKGYYGAKTLKFTILPKWTQWIFG